MSVSEVTSTSVSSHELFVVPRGQGDGFQASVRGHVLDLIDPTSYALAPTAVDLFVVSIASPLAWAARSFLRARKLPDYVSVSAEWRTQGEPPSVTNVSLTVSVPGSSEATRAALGAVLENSLTIRSIAQPVIRVSVEGAEQ